MVEQDAAARTMTFRLAPGPSSQGDRGSGGSDCGEAGNSGSGGGGSSSNEGGGSGSGVASASSGAVCGHLTAMEGSWEVVPGKRWVAQHSPYALLYLADVVASQGAALSQRACSTHRVACRASSPPWALLPPARHSRMQY